MNTGYPLLKSIKIFTELLSESIIYVRGTSKRKCLLLHASANEQMEQHGNLSVDLKIMQANARVPDATLYRYFTRAFQIKCRKTLLSKTEIVFLPCMSHYTRPCPYTFDPIAHFPIIVIKLWGGAKWVAPNICLAGEGVAYNFWLSMYKMQYNLGTQFLSKLFGQTWNCDTIIDTIST